MANEPRMSRETDSGNLSDSQTDNQNKQNNQDNQSKNQADTAANQSDRKDNITNINQKDIAKAAQKTGTEVLGQVKEKASGILGEQKSNLTSGLASVADSIRKVGENLSETEDQNKIVNMTAQYGNTLAQKIEKFSGYLENADYRAISRDVEKFARREPALFIGAAFALGLLAARFVKTSRRNQPNVGAS